MAEILVLDPWHGGSHAQVVTGWQAHSCHHLSVLGLPARNWKWRMRHAAWTLAGQARQLLEQGQHFDVIWCTDMLDVACFRALAPAGLARLPLVCYLHEHQAGYPDPQQQVRDLHFAITNLTSIAAADAVWFNSAYHRQAFIDNIGPLFSIMPDHRDDSWLQPALSRATVQEPGWELHHCGEDLLRPEGPLHLLWAARPQADKQPERFAAAVRQLVADNLPFTLSILGGHAAKAPAFADLPELLGERLLHFGHLASRAAYEEVLATADVVVSTAAHEFFGLAMVEAAAAGCCPCLPRALAYPEVFAALDQDSADLVFYDDNIAALNQRLRQHIHHPPPRGLASAAVAHLHWRQRAAAMDEAVDTLVEDLVKRTT